MDFLPKEDGINHINIYSKGKTLLGRQLSNFSPIGFSHPSYGEFASVEGFWYWLKTGKNNHMLKGLWGFEAKKFGKEFEELIIPKEEFELEIKKALWYKAIQNKTLRQRIIESELPFSHYYVFGDKKVETPKFNWITEAWEIIRSKLKEIDNENARKATNLL